MLYFVAVMIFVVYLDIESHQRDLAAQLNRIEHLLRGCGDKRA